MRDLGRGERGSGCNGQGSGEPIMGKAKMIIVGGAASFLEAVSLVGTPEARVLSMRECKTEYRAARDAGDLTRTSWKAFRRAHVCATKSLTGARARQQSISK
jgi:hypothetical protein